MLIRKDFEKIQRKTGYNLDLLEKVYHLTQILNEIQKSAILSANLTLKGGTALNFLYLDISRLSIDIDFNYTGKITKENMMRIRPSIERSVVSLGEALGYNVKERGSSYILSRHSLQYTTIRDTKDHIKVEINYLDRLPIGKLVTRRFPSIFPDIPMFSVTTYSLEEITAQKIKACLERIESRDIYDLFCLLKQKVDVDKVRKYAAVYYCMSKQDELIDIEKRLGEYDSKKMQQELQQFIRGDEKLNAEKIRKDAVELLKQILFFTDKEQRFIDTFYKERKIIPELLFKDKSIMVQHPILLHRLNELEKRSKPKKVNSKESK